MINALLASFAIATAAPVLAQPAPAQPAPGAKTEQGGVAPEMKCRSVQVVDSRIPQRICRTSAEWARIEAEARQGLEQNRRTVGAPGDDR